VTDIQQCRKRRPLLENPKKRQQRREAAKGIQGIQELYILSVPFDSQYKKPGYVNSINHAIFIIGKLSVLFEAGTKFVNIFCMNL
jgi:hypothetical protein